MNIEIRRKKCVEIKLKTCFEYKETISLGLLLFTWCSFLIDEQISGVLHTQALTLEGSVANMLLRNVVISRGKGKN